MSRIGIVADGEWRLRRAIEAEVWRKYRKAFLSAGFWRRTAIQEKVQREAQKQLRRKASLYSLWSSPRFPNWETILRDRR